MSVTLQALDVHRLDDFAALFHAGGSGCFCASWRAMDGTWNARCRDPSRPNLAITRRNVEAGLHIGFLAYENHKVVGWVAAGPKTSFPTLRSERLGARLSPFRDEVWAIGCLAVGEHGANLIEVAPRIVSAAIAAAREARAVAIESYPTRPYDVARAYRGSEDLFSALGFEVVGHESDGSSDILLMSMSL